MESKLSKASKTGCWLCDIGEERYKGGAEGWYHWAPQGGGKFACKVGRVECTAEGQVKKIGEGFRHYSGVFVLPKEKLVECPFCDGHGRRVSPAVQKFDPPCGFCRGRGVIPLEMCPGCGRPAGENYFGVRFCGRDSCRKGLLPEVKRAARRGGEVVHDNPARFCGPAVRRDGGQGSCSKMAKDDEDDARRLAEAYATFGDFCGFEGSYRA